MKTLTRLLAPFLIATLAACSTTQEVLIAKGGPTKAIATVARSPGDDNSSDMNSNVDLALAREGLTVKPPVAANVRQSPTVDAVVRYSGTWRWDIVMYLRKFTVRLYDASTGDLLASGEWNNSAFHGFQDAKIVVQNVISEVMAKLKAGSSGK